MAHSSPPPPLGLDGPVAALELCRGPGVVGDVVDISSAVMIVAGCKPPDVPFATIRPGKTGGATGGGRAGGSEYIAVTTETGCVETGFVAPVVWTGFNAPVSDAVARDVGGI
jgi:hypothetical protein